MTDPNETFVSQMEAHAASLRERAASLEKELAETRVRIRQIEDTIRSFGPSDGPAQDTSSKEWHGSAEDVKGCENVRQALTKLALMNGGIVRPSPAAKILIEAGLTESKVPARVTPGVYSRLKGWKDWEHSGKGQFRFIGEEE